MRTVHISGTSGSGKTTLGQKLKAANKNIVHVDTDEFIQHGTPEARLLLKLEKQPKKYKAEWKRILGEKVSFYRNKYPNKLLVFTGLLNNWGLDDEPYEIEIPCDKYFLNVPLPEILKRYYLRICETEKKVSKAQSDWYWNCLAKGKCHVRSSEQIMKNYDYDIKWHKSHGYKILSADAIMLKVNIRNN